MIRHHLIKLTQDQPAMNTSMADAMLGAKTVVLVTNSVIHNNYRLLPMALNLPRRGVHDRGHHNAIAGP